MLREDEALQWFVISLLCGYIIMGIPSICFLSIMKVLKNKGMKLTQICTIGGALGYALAFGFLSGALLLIFEWGSNTIISMCLHGAIIGVIVLLLLNPINNQSEPVVRSNS